MSKFSKPHFSEVFYVEYPIQDHGFRHDREVSKDEAISLLNKSPFKDQFTPYMRPDPYGNYDGDIVDFMNKGAGRIDDDHRWVYKHDFRWYILVDPCASDALDSGLFHPDGREHYEEN